MSPTVARGLGVIAVASALVTGGQALWPRRSEPERRVALVCDAPVEVVESGVSRVGCATELRDCPNAARASRVSLGKTCIVEPHGMAARMRLALGIPLDINRVTQADLERLDGVGPKLAQAIIAYRDAKGGLRDMQELNDVKGVGDKTLERLISVLAVE